MVIDKSLYSSEDIVTDEQGMQNEPLINKLIVHSKLPDTQIRRCDQVVPKKEFTKSFNASVV